MEGAEPYEAGPTIFWDFINRDRNKLLKEAEFTVGHSVMIPVQLGRLPLGARQETTVRLTLIAATSIV